MERKQWSSSSQVLEFEPPDLLHCYVNGTVQISDAEETLRVMREEIIPEVGDFYFLVHTGDKGTDAMPTETRKYFATVKPLWRATVLIGGSAVERVAANVFMRAMLILSGKQAPMRVVKTDEEAIAYINELRSTWMKSS